MSHVRHVPSNERVFHRINPPPAGLEFSGTEQAQMDTVVEKARKAISLTNKPVYQIQGAPASETGIPRAIDMRDPKNHRTVVLRISTEGSMNELGSTDGSKQLTTRISEPESLFERPAHAFVQSDGKPLPPPDMRRAAIVSVKMESSYNGFPMPVALRVAGTGEFLNRVVAGKTKALVVLEPNENKRTLQTLAELDPIFDSDQFRTYGHMTEDSVHTGIVPLTQEHKALVPVNHALATVIQRNPDMIDQDDVQLVRDGKYLEVPIDVVQSCASGLQLKVLSQIPFLDLNELAFEFVRTDGRKFHDPQSTQLKNTSQMDQDYQMKAYRFASATMQITYAFPTDAYAPQ